MKNEHKQLTVTLMVRAKIQGKWRRLPALYGRTGRVIPGRVVWHAKELVFENVAYELRHYQGGKARYVPAGKSASDAEQERRTLEMRLNARVIAEAAGILVAEPSDRKTLKTWAEQYIDEKSALVGDDQVKHIRRVIGLFLQCCPKKYPDEITSSDILEYLRHLKRTPAFYSARSKPITRKDRILARLRLPSSQNVLAPRTVFGHFMTTRAWLCAGGVDRKLFPPPPKYEEVEVTVYTPEEIETFFRLVKGNLRIATSLMLKCGLRRQEAAHAYFSDVNFSAKTILVRSKPELNFEVKNRIQRYVPVPDDLLDELRKWQQEHPRQTLIIQTPGGKPDLRLIPRLKRFVYLHGLRCGDCPHCRWGHPECERWQLHKFRRTYITAICRHVDLRTAQAYAGHLRIASTERYLKAASATEGQKRISAIDWSKPFYS